MRKHKHWDDAAPDALHCLNKLNERETTKKKQLRKLDDLSLDKVVLAKQKMSTIYGGEETISLNSNINFTTGVDASKQGHGKIRKR